MNEKLKEKLSREGYFDEKFKKPLPKNPSRIGVVTAETGMEIRKGLRKTYMWSKKVKLAIYKLIKYVPKIISGNYKRKVNEL